MAESKLARTNGDASSPTEPLAFSGAEGQISSNGFTLPLSEPIAKLLPDELVSSNGVSLPLDEPLVGSVRGEQIPPNGIHNKLLEQVIRTPGRQPSPLPTHLSIPGPSHYRVLREEGPGYVAPKFEGKDKQMEDGTFRPAMELVAELT